MANKEDFNGSKSVRCSFCGKTQDQVRRLVAGPNAYICNECILLCQEIISDDVDSVNASGEIEIKTPQEIKDVLDQYVVGQEAAKKALCVAVYNHYACFADNSGLIQCVDINTMTPVWAFAAGDDTDASLALEETGDGVSIYTACELDLRGSTGDCHMRRLNLLTGEEIWRVDEPCHASEDYDGGCFATPAIGKGSLADYVYFHVGRTVADGGTLFLDERCDPGVEKVTANQMIYGHDMHDGTMFGKLHLYAGEDYGKEHSLIRFDTLHEVGEYQLLAAFYTQVYYTTDTCFKYYQFFDAENEEEFNDYVENVKALAEYDTGVSAKFGDTLLTLSTCAYHTESGRFIVVAKKV